MEQEIIIKKSAEVLAEENMEWNMDMTGDDSLKQNILTHVIDGFVIEESLSPFPFGATSMLSNQQLNMIRKRQQEILAREKDEEDSLSIFDKHQDQEEVDDVATATCEQCGFYGPRSTFSPPSRQFCSLKCARKFTNGRIKNSQPSKLLRHSNVISKQGGRGMLRSRSLRSKSSRGRFFSVNKAPMRRDSASNSLSDDSSFSECEECHHSSDEGSVFSCSSSPSPEPAIPYDGDVPLRPMYWSVNDVWNFIRSLPGALQHAEDFRAQEIDGSALLLLHEEHLVGSMNLPLGPALKLCAHIDRLRERELS